MLSLRLCVVMAAAIIGFSAAQSCSSLTGAYNNNTLCASAQTLQQTLCTCTGSKWNSTNTSYPFCTWSNATMAGNYTGVAGCFATYSSGINAWVVGSGLSTACLNDYSALRSCLVSLQAGTSSLWNGTGMYTGCQAYATTVFTNTAGSAATSANLAAACPTPLSYTIYFTFGGNWSFLLTRTSRRARARAASVFYTNVVNGIMADMAKATGYTPSSVTLQLTANSNCLATISMPISQGAGTSFVAVYGGAGAALALFKQTSFWFTAGGGIGSFTVLGAGNSPIAFTPVPTPAPTPVPPTPVPSGASVATVAHVVLAVLALVLLA